MTHIKPERSGRWLFELVCLIVSASFIAGAGRCGLAERTHGRPRDAAPGIQDRPAPMAPSVPR